MNPKLIPELQFHFAFHFTFAFLMIWKSNLFLRSLTVCFLILVLYYSFVDLSLNILFFCLFLVFIDIFQTWTIICLFVFVCSILFDHFLKYKLKSKLFNQEINIYFWIQKYRLNWILMWHDFQKYNSFLNLLNVSCNSFLQL